MITRHCVNTGRWNHCEPLRFYSTPWFSPKDGGAPSCLSPPACCVSTRHHMLVYAAWKESCAPRGWSGDTFPVSLRCIPAGWARAKVYLVRWGRSLGRKVLESYTRLSVTWTHSLWWLRSEGWNSKKRQWTRRKLRGDRWREDAAMKSLVLGADL